MDSNLLIAFITAFAVAAAIGPFIIKTLRRLKFGQKILEDGPKWHLKKQNIPTMGGFIFIIAIIAAMAVSVAFFGIENCGRWILILSMSLVFGVVGFIDDWNKIKKRRNKGLNTKQKFFLQLAVSVLFITLMRYFGLLNPVITIPFINYSFEMPWVLYIALMSFIIVGFDNAVNITDGVDGLASGVTLAVMAFFTFTAALIANSAEGTEEIARFAALPAAVCGALGGFLIYNYNPARVIMGDTGSLFLGGLVAGMAFAVDMPLILLPVGLIYVIETLSVIIQVTYFKATGGKRIFKMAPIHHHFEMCGWSERKIVAVAFTVTAVMCALTYLSLTGLYTA